MSQTERIKRYYFQAIARDIGHGMVVRIAPLPHDVPEIESARTTKEGNLLITFATGDREFKTVFSDNNLEIEIGLTTQQLARIRIKAPDVKGVLVEIHEQFATLRRQFLEKVRNISDPRAKLREVGRADIVERQLDESEAVINEFVGESR
jgi:hypothetical protein